MTELQNAIHRPCGYRCRPVSAVGRASDAPPGCGGSNFPAASQQRRAVVYPAYKQTAQFPSVRPPSAVPDALDELRSDSRSRVGGGVKWSYVFPVASRSGPRRSEMEFLLGLLTRVLRHVRAAGACSPRGTDRPFDTVLREEM